MIDEDRRSRLVAKLIVLTQGNKLRWVPALNENSLSAGFLTEESGLRFEIGRCREFRSLYHMGPKVSIKVFDSETGPNNLIDTFTDRDLVPILRDLYEIVEQKFGDVKMKNAKIDAFLTNDVTHAQ
jgi:hypothetical protein